MENFKTKNVEIVEVSISNTSQTRFSLPNVPNIQGKKVIAVEIYDLSKVTKAPSGNAILNATVQKYGFLTLSIDGKEKVKDMPFQSLIAANNNGQIFQIENANVDPQKSYVNFATTTGLVANEIVLIAFHYE